MKNLKRVFSMALATVMLMGTMAVANAADFTDGEDITHVEAVNTMVALNIINGKDDGSFDPEATVTRAEMAKMITIALNGGVDPVLGTQTTPKFSDIGGHWAQKYIEYCANLGIINGRGNGTFDPAGTVTGTEAAKMILVAMGYDSTVFNFTGADWATNVNVEANNATPNKLYAGIMGIDPSKGLSRDNAAQMIYNGVQDHMMTKSPEMTITNGEISWRYSKSSQTILNTKYNAHVYTAVVLANEYAGVSGGTTKAGEFKISAWMEDDEYITNSSGGASTMSMTVKGTVPLELLGKSVKIIVADTKTAGVYNTVYGDPMLADVNNIYTVDSSKTSAAVTLTNFTNGIESEGIDASTIGSASVYLNYSSTTAIASASALKGMTANGKVIEVIDNDGDGIVEYIMIKNPAIGQVTTYNEKGNAGAGYVTVASKSGLPAGTSAIAAKKFEKIVGVENIAKDDFIAFFELNGTYFVEKLETVTGTVTKKDGDNTIIVDGETYKNSNLVTVYDEDRTLTTLKDATTVGEEVTLYLDPCGYVVCAVGPEAATSYAFLTAVENVGDITGARARVVFSDGTKAVINVVAVKKTVGTTTTTYKVDGAAGNKLSNVIGTSLSIDPANPEQVVKYSEDGGDYTLTIVDNDKTLTGADGDKITQGNANLVTGIKADSKTVFLIKDSAGNYTPYTGIANVPTMNKSVKAFIADDGETPKTAEFVVVTNGAPTATKSIYILDRQVKVELNANGNKIYTVPALVDGEYNGALELKNDGGEAGTLTVTRGLYSGDAVALESGKLDISLLNGTADANKYYADAAYLTSVRNGNVTGQTIACNETDGNTTTSATLTLTNDTKYIIIEGAAEDKVFEGTVDDLAYDKTATDGGDLRNNAKIIMVRADNDSTKAGFYQAGIIYIVR